MKQFQINALFVKTNRQRKLILNAKCEMEVVSKLVEMGYREPFEILELPPEPATEAQLKYANNLNINVPNNVSKDDLSVLIQKKLDFDSDPNPELIDFANEIGMDFSKYIGKKSLYNLIFNKLELKDKIAFFIFCIYRWLSDDRKGNLAKHPYKLVFYEFSNIMISNERFIKSMNNYSGSDLRFFGVLKFDNGRETYGGSQNTIAYKYCIEFLTVRFDINKTKTRTLKSKNYSAQSNTSNNLFSFSTPNTFESSTKQLKKKGCFGSNVLLLIIIISLLFVDLSIN